MGGRHQWLEGRDRDESLEVRRSPLAPLLDFVGGSDFVGTSHAKCGVAGATLGLQDDWRNITGVTRREPRGTRNVISAGGRM